MYSGFYCSPSHGGHVGMFFNDRWYVTNESCVYVSHWFFVSILYLQCKLNFTRKNRHVNWFFWCSDYPWEIIMTISGFYGAHRAPKIRCFLLGSSTCTAINKIANFSYTSKEARPMCTGARNVLWDKRGAARDFTHSHKYNCIHSSKIFWLVNDRSSPTLFAWWFLALQEGWETS